MIQTVTGYREDWSEHPIRVDVELGDGMYIEIGLTKQQSKALRRELKQAENAD